MALVPIQPKLDHKLDQDNQGYFITPSYATTDEFIHDLLGAPSTGARFLVDAQSGDIHIQPAYPNNRPRHVVRLLKITEKQVADDFLVQRFEGVRADGSASWWDHFPNHEWDIMSKEEVFEAVNLAARAWDGTMAAMVSVVASLPEHLSEDLKQTSFDFLSKVFVLIKKLPGTESPESTTNKNLPMDDRVNVFFHELSRLVSDLIHVLDQVDDHTLRSVNKLPSRHGILLRIDIGAPSNEDLLTTTRAIINALPEDDRSCAICLTTWDGQTIANIINSIRTTGPWLSSNSRSLLLNPHFKAIPLQMPTGHVFCAGCIKAWLDRKGALECPMRDMSYGVHRSRALLELEVAIFDKIEGEERSESSAELQ